MTPLFALIYSFLFGMLHGILPDEHTWPITFSYAIGGASGKEGVKAGIFFSIAFTFQRALLSEISYLALAPFLLSPTINGIVYFIVGAIMSIAGVLVLRKNRYIHLHLLGHHHDEAREMGTTFSIFGHQHREERLPDGTAPPSGWALVHGFIAGFGFGGFSLFINTVAAPAMPSAWLGFLPGLLFGLGTMLMLIGVGYVFGASLRWTKQLTQPEIKRVGAQTGGRTLFFGGLLFAAFGIATLLKWDQCIPIDTGDLLIGLFMIAVAVPSFLFSWKEVRAEREGNPAD